MKETILNQLLADLEKSVATFEERIQELKGVSDLDENSTKDPEDLSNQNVSKDMEMRYNVQLQQAKNDLTAVRQLSEKKNDTIAPGSLIETSQKWFFVGISSPAIDINGKELICFSTSAPIFSTLEGKKAGDSFKLGKDTYTISRIY